MKSGNTSKKDDKDSGAVDSTNQTLGTKSPSNSKSDSNSRSHSKSHSRSRSRSRSHSASKSKSESKSSKKSPKSSEDKHTAPKQRKPRDSKEMNPDDDKKRSDNSGLPPFPNFMGQPFNPKHFPMQGGLFPPHYGGFPIMNPLHFPPTFFRPQGPMYYNKPYKKMGNNDDNDKNAPNLLQNLGMGFKHLRMDKSSGARMKGKKKSEDKPVKTKKSIEDVLVFRKFHALPLTTEIFLTVQGFLQFSDQNLHMNISKKLLADFEKKCKENKMKNLAKSLSRYLINFNEMIKKEKEKELKETKESKKKNKEGKSGVADEKENENSVKVKDFEIIKWLHEGGNPQNLLNKVNLANFNKVEEFNISPLEKCLESKSIFEESKELFLRKFQS